MDYYKLNRLLGIGNIVVIALLILEKGIQISLLPLIAFALATSVSSSPRILGISLIVGSLDLYIFEVKVIPLFLLLQALVLTALGILSLKVKYTNFIALPLAIALYVISPDLPLYLYSFAILGSILIIFERKVYPSLFLIVALPFFLVQLFYLYSISLLTTNFSFYLLNQMAINSKYMLPADAIVITIAYIKRKSFYSIIPSIVILSSLIVAFVFLFLAHSLFSLMYSSSSAIVASNSLSDDDIETLIVNYIDNKELISELLSVYNRDINSFYCELVKKGDCKAIVKLPDAIPFKINYSLCDLTKIGECFEKLQQVPSKDIISFLMIAKEKDIVLAEKIGKLALSIAPSPKLLRLLDEIEILRKEYLKYNWDPLIWIDREINGYKIVKYLGKGGSAYVLVGEKGDKKYAIKIPILMPPSIATESYYDFLNEYSQARELSANSKYIVKFVDAQIDMSAIRKISQGDVLAYINEPPILVLEYMEGGNAKELTQNDTIFYSDEWQKIVLQIAIRVAKALDEIHSNGFVHLDVKPSNILFSKPPGKTGKEVLENLIKNNIEVKISDLGSARKIGEKISQFTPEYCPVDQVEAIIEDKGADPSMDIYAFGATLYKMLTRNDFNPPDLVKLYSEISFVQSQKGDPKPILQKAKEIYNEYYNNLTISEVNPKLADLIKAMTNPTKRPTIREVINKLEEIMNDNERNSNTG